MPAIAATIVVVTVAMPAIVPTVVTVVVPAVSVVGVIVAMIVMTIAGDLHVQPRLGGGVLRGRGANETEQTNRGK